MMQNQEHSDSEIPLFRNTNPKEGSFNAVSGSKEKNGEIIKHIEKHIGKVSNVLHDNPSDLMHPDVLWVQPSGKYPFHTFITSGMSDKQMNVPLPEDNKHAELCLLLPEDWFFRLNIYGSFKEAFRDEKNFWPIRWLKTIARFPHDYDTWLGYGHTVPNGEGALPFAENTKLGCFILLPPHSLSDDFFELKINAKKSIKFYCLYPLFREEMEYKLKMGLGALLEKLEKHKVSDIIIPDRTNTCSKA